MQTLDLTLLVKTFIRPMCLKNFLKSVVEYQKVWDIKFSDIVIIDDSDDENNNENIDVINNYSDLNITYKHYEYNSLGLSKGRNVGLEFIKTSYFIYCDDDYIFDLDCDIKSSYNTIIEKNIDILGGYCKQVKSLEAKKFSCINWVGFIQENEEYDLCNIYEDIFPELMKCDILLNFYIAKTESVKKVGYPEEYTTNEHNFVFYRFKKANFEVYSTNKLFVKHFHVSNNKKSKTYTNHRSKFVNPYKKPVIGILSTKDKLIRFDDYSLGHPEKYISENNNKKYRFKLNLLICKIDVYMSLFKTIDKLINKLKKTKSI